MNNSWRVELSSQWNVLGPFPIHAREQYYLSPAHPLDLSGPIDWSKSWPSSYADGGAVGWSKVYSDVNGDLEVSFPNIRWDSLRATEGWAALQYHAVLKTQLTLYPPTSGSEPVTVPKLLIQLCQASFFAIMPSCDEQWCTISTPRWYQGNIYAFRDAIPHTVELPTKPSFNSPTTYDLFVGGDYEIRLFGDPRTTGSECPILKANISIAIEEPVQAIVRAENQDLICNFIEGIAFGNTIGFGLRSVAGWWTVRTVTLFEPPPTSSISLELSNTIQIAPSQTRVIPLVIAQQAPVHSPVIGFFVTVKCGNIERVMKVVIPISHLKCWDVTSCEPIRATYFHPTCTPTYFLALPPQFPAQKKHHAPILALHGAGVDIIQERFWVDALPRQQHSWIVIPTGRTSWGLDWHGPSAQDAWTSVDALAQILEQHNQWRNWGYPPGTPVVVLGHSNGGQGAWYLASRFPDRVLGVVPAAAYIKSQSYVPFTLSRSAHYVDPALRAVLETALTPDDNDLHLSNLAHTPVCAIHGGNDENVPVWHTREAISVLRTWASLSGSIGSMESIKYQEDKGFGHWYPSVFQNDDVKSFLHEVSQGTDKRMMPTHFTITVASASESGPVHGWRIEQFVIPGRLARMHIEKTDGEPIQVSTSNVFLFSFTRPQCSALSFLIDDTEITLKESDISNTVRFERMQLKTWRVAQREDKEGIQQSGRLQLILTTTGHINLVIPRKECSHELSLALRLAHDLQQFHKIDADILDDEEALARFEQLEHGLPASGNSVVIGNASMKFVQRVLSFKKTPFSLERSVLTLNGRPVDLDKSKTALFLHPPLNGLRGLLLFMLSSCAEGLERGVRLFPLRTGVPVPDWILVGKGADRLGVAGVQAAGVWGRQWGWNQPASWIDIGLD